MQLLDQYNVAESFERYLGDPSDPGSPISFASALELDEREEYPAEAHRCLDHWGLPEMYIPGECNGRLKSFEEVFALLRSLSRRDLTVALSHAITFLGALPVWIAGSEDQKRIVAELIRARRKISFALTEAAHGADLLANEFEARQEIDRYLVSGEKWLIGNATQATAITVLARTRPQGGPRGFSLLFADKRFLDSTAFHHLPKVSTVGLRGSEISGIAFDQCSIPVSARIGPNGAGFELALKTLQITRTLVTGLSLGAADTALRLAVDFAITRRIYGGAVFDIPHARSTLTGAFIDLMICDCVAISAARALQVCPDQASVWSAVTKYFVPARLDNAMREVGVVLGARFFVRSGHPWSMFQKMVRDSSIVSVFEGTSVVQLHALGLQLEQLLTARVSQEMLDQRLRAAFSLQAPLPIFEPRQLDLLSRDGCDPISGIPLLDEQLHSERVSEALLVSVAGVSRRSRELISDVGRARELSERSAGMLDLARRYTQLHAAACCIAFWIHNRGILGDFFAREGWLADCLNRLFGDGVQAVDNVLVERELVERHRSHRLFSVVPLQLALHGAPIANE